MNSIQTKSNLGSSRILYCNLEQELVKEQPSYVGLYLSCWLRRTSYDVGIGGNISNANAF